MKLAGTRHLLRLTFRRDRKLLPWILCLGISPVVYAASFNALYKTAAERASFAHESASNGTLVALYGPLNGSTLGDLATWRSYFLLVVIGLVSLLMVIRHTRVEEEQGRAELLGAGVVGRQANVMAALIETYVANIMLCVFVAITLVARGLPFAGSLALGTEFMVVGWTFASIGAVTAQLATFASRARGLAITALAAAYVLRIIGDLRARSHDSFSWVSWLSPIGLAQRIRPYSENAWWIAILCVVIAFLVAAVAFTLSERRDLGAGILQPRPGPPSAASTLRNPLALAWRLQRGLLLSWVGGMALIGIVLGSVANSAGSLLGDSKDAHDLVTRLGGQTHLVDAYLATTMGIVALAVSACAMQSAMVIRNEETRSRAEPLLATAVSRSRWVGSHLLMTLGGSTLIVITTGITTGLTYGSNTGNLTHDSMRVLAAAVVQLPAIWALASLTFAAIGVAPRFTSIGWVALGLCLLTTMVGTAMQWNHWVLDASPFSHITKLPGNEVKATPLVILMVMTGVLTAIGFGGIRHRSIPS